MMKAERSRSARFRAETRTLPILCVSISLFLAGIVCAESEIDRILQGSWEAKKVRRNSPASDETFLRRIYLDVIGRIPTFEEAHRFLDSEDPEKRSKLIDDLLASEGYVNHFVNFWADILRINSRQGGGRNVAPYYMEFVRDALRKNLPYDEFVYTLITAQGEASSNGAVGYTFRDRGMPLEHLSNTMRIFLGTRLECAQCHNHPFDKWTQMDFYGMAAFSYGMDVNNRALQSKLTEIQRTIYKLKLEPKPKAALQGAFRDVMGAIPPYNQMVSYDPEKLPKLPHDYQYDDATPKQIVKPGTLFGESIELKEDDDALDVFARWISAPDNHRFNRVIANRLWKKVMGRGLIEPADELVDATVASDPALMDFLERFIVENNYDIKAFLRAIYHSKVYQSEVPTGEVNQEDDYHFTGPLLRRMTSEQIWDSIVALVNPNPEAGDWKKQQEREIQLAHGKVIRDATENYQAAAVMEFAKAVAGFRGDLDEKKVALTEEATAARKAKNTEHAAALALQIKEVQARQRLRIDHLVYEPELRTSDIDMVFLSLPNGRQEPARLPELININGEILATQLRKVQTQMESDLVDQELKREGIADPAGKQEYLNYRKVTSKIVRAAHMDSPAPPGHFLRQFGQSDRNLIENASIEPAVPQKLEMMNGQTFELISTGRSVFSRKLKTLDGYGDKLDFIFLSLLSRYPTANESEWMTQSEIPLDDVIFALLNSTEFLFLR